LKFSPIILALAIAAVGFYRPNDGALVNALRASPEVASSFSSFGVCRSTLPVVEAI
jgi:hypothetical protein